MNLNYPYSFVFRLTRSADSNTSHFVMATRALRTSFRQPISYHYYTTLVNRWVTDIGLDKTQYGTHSLRRTKASLIYAKTKNLRAIQLLLGHAKLESTIEYLGFEIEDALRISESCET
ncbi:tyrosine-type recombinase/integrase [Vibrio parahaemolyticus]|uniref:tyrosine-type recombinase/integrase n=1 Tax=Vibrio parahaemolyticus TaxID=670 RepID=UPI0021531219|nr:tyrosine-type recombinase/integrase [Vibrio parahaemolyticus]MDS1866636.1 tyrosine-type recombinase/integrase [Vibrio parahaemolyticus]